MAAEVNLLQDAILVKALEDFVIAGRELLIKAVKERQEGSIQEFISKKIGSLLGFTVAAADFLNRLSVKKRKDAEEVWKKFYHCSDVRDHVEDFLQLEVDWDEFLKGLDKELNLCERFPCQVPLGGYLSGEVTLTDAKSGQSVSLGSYFGKDKSLLLVLLRHFARDHMAELESNQGLLDALSVRVLVISFGCCEGARYWLEETGCKYDMLLDPERRIYNAFGLGSSVYKVWSFSSLFLYAEYKVSNCQFLQTPANVVNDIYQFGGDFVLDDDGKVIYFHPSKTPADRPTVTALLTAISEASPGH
uniref:Uncharacterized protein n=1 Tax=Lepisosteus oculatus TaxID=7918 RepID=W5NFI6_LEPOC